MKNMRTPCIPCSACEFICSNWGDEPLGGLPWGIYIIEFQ